MKYIYASRTGNVEKLIQSLGLEAKKLADGTEKLRVILFFLPIRTEEVLYLR